MRKREAEAIEEVNGETVAKQRRSSGIESFFMNNNANVNVNANEEIDISDECTDVFEEGPAFFDHG